MIGKHKRHCKVAFAWPEQPFHVVLVEPEIPPNTGNVARLCAATGSILHLVEPLGFRISDAELRRAGLDYWPFVDLRRHSCFDAYLDAMKPARFFLFTTGAPRSLYDTRFEPGDALVFGSETRGLSDELLARFPEQTVAIPVRGDRVRSLNLASAVAVALYEALRQVGAEGSRGN